MLSRYTQTIQQNHSLPQIQFSSLNLSSLSISVINQIPTKLIFISQLNLDNNLIVSLAGIEQFMNLQVLSLNFNFISEKGQLLNVRNKFLIKELSLLGNQVQSYVSATWLKQQGFSNLVRFNDINKIGNLATTKSPYRISESPRFAGHSFQKQSHNHDHKAYELIHSSKLNDPSSQQDTQTKRYHNNYSHSQSFNIIHPDITYRLSKNKQRFQSTGDTRKNKISHQQFNETSRQRNSFDSSPNLNNQFRDNSFQNLNNQHQQQYLSSTKRTNISEFKLYPVDEEMNRSRLVQREVIEPSHIYRGFPEQNSRNHYRKVRPFQSIMERPYQGNQKQKYAKYRSEHYSLDQGGAMSNQGGAQMRTRSQQSDNYIIEREIPVYKQAIAIAFYYRNLLEKVFRGYNMLINQEIQHQSHQRDESHSKDEQLKENHSSQVQNEGLTSQMDLKRYAWMKLQLFSNHKKVMDKYMQPLKN